MKTRNNYAPRLCIVALLIAVITLSALSAQTGTVQIREEGMASWYGHEFKGRKTSSGEIFDPELFTAAHRLLPFGTIITVTNLQNGKSVQAKVNDRGPFVEGRALDLSKAAADAIGMIGSGVARIRIEASLSALPAGLAVDAGVLKAESAKPAAQAVALTTPGTDDPLRVIQVASYANRDSALNLIKYLYDNGVEATEELPGGGIYRVVINGVPLSKVPLYQNNLNQLGFPQVLVRQK